MTAIEGTHALITGGSSGIGLETARALGRAGARVSLVARRPEVLAEAAATLGAEGIGVRMAAADVSDQAALHSAIADLAADGPVDILVTSAGQARPGHFLELDDEVFRQMMEVDYFGTLHAIRAVAPGMVERRRGSIVAISSAAGLLGIYGYSAYGPAKFAVRGLMESLRGELAPYDVHVACVFPADVDTPQLAEEDEFKPAETRAISGTVQPVPPGRVAAAIVKAIEKERFAVYSDRTTAALAATAPALAPMVRRYLDARVRSVR